MTVARRPAAAFWNEYDSRLADGFGFFEMNGLPSV